MTTDDTIGVIGAGSWGTTLAKVLGENGKRTLLWARREDLCREINETHQSSHYLPGFTLAAGVEATPSLERVCKEAAFIIAVVPSHTMRETARQLGNFLTGEHVVVHATKGIEQGTFKRMSEVLREETCLRKIGVISGPNLAKELAARHPTGTLVASRYVEVFERAHAALHNDYFRVYQGRDVVGAEVGGAFKNIIALAAGVAAGLGLGDNTKALLLTRGLSEMARFGVAMGAEVMTFGGMAGMGDLIATCSSPLSRNHQVGARLARGEKLEDIQRDMRMVAEGVKMAKAADDFATKKRIELPIVRAVHNLLYQHHEVPLLLKELMSIPAGPEFAALSV
jgi:glycerol-3-phosphate dehydrogenase (NAD(P)+)